MLFKVIQSVSKAPSLVKVSMYVNFKKNSRYHLKKEIERMRAEDF